MLALCALATRYFITKKSPCQMTILAIFLNSLIDQKSRYISLNEGSE